MKRKILCLLLVVFCASCGNSIKLEEEDLEKLTRGKLTELSELGTVSYNVTKIVKGSKEGRKAILGKKSILYSITATLKAGIILKDLPSENVIIDVNKKKVTLIIPHAKLLSMSIAPNDVEKIEENTGWLRKKFNHIEKQEIIVKGEDDIKNDLDKIGIINDAERNAKLFLESLMKNIGYKEVIVEFKN